MQFLMQKFFRNIGFAIKSRNSKSMCFKVNDVFRSGRLAQSRRINNEISKFDFLFVNLALDYERKTGQPLNPNEVFPQIWDEIMQNLHKYRI